MEHANDIAAAESSETAFDEIEIIGLVVPLLFAIMTIVLVALAPDSTEVSSEAPKTTSERAEFTKQIQNR